MGLSKEDIKAIGDEMDHKLKGVHTRLDTLESEIGIVKADITSIKTDVGFLNTYLITLDRKVVNMTDSFMRENSITRVSLRDLDSRINTDKN